MNSFIYLIQSSENWARAELQIKVQYHDDNAQSTR